MLFVLLLYVVCFDPESEHVCTFVCTLDFIVLAEICSLLPEINYHLLGVRLTEETCLK